MAEDHQNEDISLSGKNALLFSVPYFQYAYSRPKTERLLVNCFSMCLHYVPVCHNFFFKASEAIP